MSADNAMLELPVGGGNDEAVWGSDVVAEMLRQLGIKYVCLNPGASFRGLHDSIVNYLGNRSPQMLLCLHEEHAIAIAHGYAKISGEPLAAIVHSNVGLMHGSMAIFNAWCDRVPVLVFGATGPVDAARRRPWIDWIHTARDQGALVRSFTKWDDQPASVAAAIEAMLRANILARTAPAGPVYICLDAAMQEQRLEAMPELPPVSRFQPPATGRPPQGLVQQAVEWLGAARTPVILAGRVSRDGNAWAQRVALAERLGAKVITDLKVGAAFPTDHALHCGKPGYFLNEQTMAALRAADVILSLDWVDLAGTLKQAWPDSVTTAKVIQVSVDQYIHNGWSMDHQGLPPVDLYLACEPDRAVDEFFSALDLPQPPALVPLPCRPLYDKTSDADVIDLPGLAAGLGVGLAGEEICLIRLPLGWDGGFWHFGHPLDFLGSDGGGGIGAGPGLTVGAALALKGSGRLPVAVLGDGDFLMGVTAIWTAVHYGIPLLIVVANNRSFFNDEIHQERVATQRARPVVNKWIGQHIGEPDVDLAALARGQGAEGIGPIVTPQALAQAVARGVSLVKAGQVVVVDARLQPTYSPTAAAGLVRNKS